MASTISTHILDTSLGSPARGVQVVLERIERDGSSVRIGSGHTDDDGRLRAGLADDNSLIEGRYRLTFETGHYFESTGRETFFPSVSIDFRVGSTPQHYHVPLLISPFGYSTYRGS
jgi:5-hydroxyisourate hydrolase